MYPVVRGVFELVYADADEVESRLSFDHHGDPDVATRASTEFRRSYRLSCAILCVSIADPRRLGAGSSSLPPSWPTNCGSMSGLPGEYTHLSDDILRFVP